MSDEPEQPSAILAFLHRQHRLTGAVLLALGLVLAGGMVWLVFKNPRWDLIVLGIFGSLLALDLAGAGAWQLGGESRSVGPIEATRLLVLVVGGVAGLLLWLASLTLLLYPPPQGLPNEWWNAVTGGLEVWQGKEWWRLWVIVLANFGGLAILFVSLLLGRSQERSSPLLRRIIYGYNAALGGLLLAAILMIANILAFAYLPAVSDWTAAGLYTLSSESKNILTGLEKPVKIHVFEAGRGDLLSNEVQALLDNCRNVNDKIQVEYLSRDRDFDKAQALVKRYQLIDAVGVLVVYGDEGREDHEFIKREDLASQQRGQDSFSFRGEEALMTALKFLSEGKSRPVLYFTQNNEELDLTDTDSTRIDRGASNLRSRLKKGNYEVKGLKLGPVGVSRADPDVVVASKVPDDAAVVIVAGPRTPFGPEALQALHDYMKKKKGKMVMLFDVVVDRDGKMVPSGLENLLVDYLVEVDNKLILTVQNQNPQQIQVRTNPQLRERNPVAAAFEGEVLPMVGVRGVSPRRVDALIPGADRIQAEPLLLTRGLVWAEDNLKTSPVALLKDYMQASRREEFEGKLTQQPLSVAVAVTEAGGDPHAPPMPGAQVPRLVVFGDATIACNVGMAEGARTGYYDLFASTLAWLRERPSGIGIKPKQRDAYTLSPNTNVVRMVWLPALMMFVGILGLGAGVWVVRRR